MKNKIDWHEFRTVILLLIWLGTMIIVPFLLF